VKDTKDFEKGISDIVGVFTDPIIVYPSGWEDTMPDWIKGAITLERLVMNVRALKGDEMTGTDAEALAYMYPACLSFPLDHDWTQIYLYLGSQVMQYHNPFQKEEPFPDDIKVESLSDYQMGKLNHLKAWIYEKRRGVRQDRERAGRRQEKEEKAERKRQEQPAMFDFASFDK